MLVRTTNVVLVGEQQRSSTSTSGRRSSTSTSSCGETPNDNEVGFGWGWEFGRAIRATSIRKYYFVVVRRFAAATPLLFANLLVLTATLFTHQYYSAVRPPVLLRRSPTGTTSLAQPALVLLPSHKHSHYSARTTTRTASLAPVPLRSRPHYFDCVLCWHKH